MKKVTGLRLFYWLKSRHVTHIVNSYRYGISVSKMTICRKHFPHSSLITGFVTIETPRVPLVDQELLTLPGHLSSLMVISGVRVTRSLALCICFVDHCLFFCSFSFGHCVVCSSSIYGFWLPLWYLQTLLTQCWLPISTKRTITSHLYLLNKNKTYTCVLKWPWKGGISK
jgi:hypothetical protein